MISARRIAVVCLVGLVSTGLWTQVAPPVGPLQLATVSDSQVLRNVLTNDSLASIAPGCFALGSCRGVFKNVGAHRGTQYYTGSFTFGDGTAPGSQIRYVYANVSSPPTLDDDYFYFKIATPSGVPTSEMFIQNQVAYSFLAHLLDLLPSQLTVPFEQDYVVTRIFAYELPPTPTSPAQGVMVWVYESGFDQMYVKVTAPVEGATFGPLSFE